eukprot:6184300-Pleurochrysis_carterae.AAC.6
MLAASRHAAATGKQQARRSDIAIADIASAPPGNREASCHQRNIGLGYIRHSKLSSLCCIIMAMPNDAIPVGEKVAYSKPSSAKHHMPSSLCSR